MSKIDSWQLKKKKKKAISNITYHEILARLWHIYSGSGKKERKDNDRTIIILVTNMLSSCMHLHAQLHLLASYGILHI